MTTAPASPLELAFVRVTRSAYPDRATYIAVRPDHADRIVATSTAGTIIERCDLALPPEVAAPLAGELAADPEREDVLVGSTWEGRWFDGPLKGQAAP